MAMVSSAYVVAMTLLFMVQGASLLMAFLLAIAGLGLTMVISWVAAQFI